jgi:hypothetical protein
VVFTVPAEMTGRHVRLELLSEDHRAGLRAAADDPRIWEHMLVSAVGPDFDRVFDDALAERAAGRRVMYHVPPTSTWRRSTSGSRSAGRGTGRTSGSRPSTRSASCSCSPTPSRPSG